MTDSAGVVPEIDRRAPAPGMTAHVADTLIGKQSRKVAFGVWGFIADNAFLATGKISESTWWHVFLTCALLIGFGTILDDVLAKVGDKLVGFVVGRVNTMISTTETSIEKKTETVTT